MFVGVFGCRFFAEPKSVPHLMKRPGCLIPRSEPLQAAVDSMWDVFMKQRSSLPLNIQKRPPVAACFGLGSIKAKRTNAGRPQRAYFCEGTISICVPWHITGVSRNSRDPGHSMMRDFCPPCLSPRFGIHMASVGASDCLADPSQLGLRCVTLRAGLLGWRHPDAPSNYLFLASVARVVFGQVFLFSPCRNLGIAHGVGPHLFYAVLRV